MINQSTNLEQLLLELTKDAQEYYIKQKSLGSFEELNGNRIYSRFKPYKGNITPTLLQQHLKKEITLAINLKKEDILLYEYRGNRVYAFGTLFFKLLNKELIAKSHIIKYSEDMLLIYLKFKNKEDVEHFKKQMQEALLVHLEKEWRVYPLKERPKLGNLMELPREYIESPWSF